MGALTDKLVNLAMRLLSKRSSVTRRLGVGSASGTALVSGAVGGLSVAVLLLLLPNPLVDFTQAPGWERLRTLMLFASVVGGAIGGPWLVLVNELLCRSRGFARILIPVTLSFGSGALVVLIHCMASWDAPRCRPNWEWLALGGSMGLTTVLAMYGHELRLPEAPVRMAWTSIRSALCGLVVYEAVHSLSLLLGLDFPHMGRGVVSALSAALFLAIVQFGLWLQAGGMAHLEKAFGEQDS